MTNPYYVPDSANTARPGQTVRSAQFNDNNNTIEQGFDLLPVPVDLFSNRQNFGISTADVANVYEVSIEPTVLTSYQDGMQIEVRFPTANTGPAQLNLNSLGVKQIRTIQGQPVRDGDIVANASGGLRFDLANDWWQLDTALSTTQNFANQAEQSARESETAANTASNEADRSEGEADRSEGEADRAQRISDSLGIAPSGDYRGLWPDSGGSATEGDTWQTQTGGTPTGQYFTALQNTTVDPVSDDVNWRKIVSNQSVGGLTNYQAASVQDMVSGLGGTVNPDINVVWNTTDYHSDIKGGGAKYLTTNITPSEVGLINHDLGDGIYAVFQPEKDSQIKARQAGARFDDLSDDLPSFKAIRDLGFRRVILGIGVSLWSGRVVYQDFNNLYFVGAGNTKFIELGGYQPHITQITPTFDSTDPLLDIRGGVNNTVKSVSFIANQGVRDSYSGSALRHYAGSSSLNEKVTSSGFKLGQILEGHIYGVQRDCFSENGSDGFSYEGIGGVSQTNTCEVYGCRVRQVHTGFAVNSCTGLNLHSPKGEIISDRYASDRATNSGLILDANNRNLSITGTAYLEGADQFWQAPQTNPSIGTVINDFYYRNPEDYVISGFKQDFGILGADTVILSGFIAETTNYSGAGLPTDTIGRIRPKDRCQITGVTGGFIEIDSTVSPNTIIIGRNNLGVSRFEGVFYLTGADTSNLYSNLTRKRYHVGNFEITLNASGYAEVDTGLGINRIGSLIINPYVTVNTSGDIITSYQDGTGTIRLYVRTASGTLITSTTRRINLTVDVVANF